MIVDSFHGYRVLHILRSAVQRLGDQLRKTGRGEGEDRNLRCGSSRTATSTVRCVVRRHSSLS